MNVFIIADKYIITEKDNEYFWEESIELEDGTKMVLKGDCFLDENLDMIFLSPWTENYFEEQEENKDLSLWNKTKFYSVVEENGGLKIFYCETGEQVNNELQKSMSKKIGCTMKYR
jgi:hypothetical protein